MEPSGSPPSPHKSAPTQDEGNTLLSDNYLEMLTILRMNRGFMDFMRTHYNDAAEQEFKMTVVRAPTAASAAPPPGPSTPGPSTPATFAGACAASAAAAGAFETPTSWDATEPRLAEEVDEEGGAVLPAELEAMELL